MNYMLVRHKVADYAVWKSVFESHASARQAAGLKVEKVLRNVDDPSEVVLLFEVADLQKARSFVSAPGVAEVREQAGVSDEPDIYFLS